MIGYLLSSHSLPRKGLREPAPSQPRVQVGEILFGELRYQSDERVDAPVRCQLSHGSSSTAMVEEEGGGGGPSSWMEACSSST